MQVVNFGVSVQAAPDRAARAFSLQARTKAAKANTPADAGEADVSKPLPDARRAAADASKDGARSDAEEGEEDEHADGEEDEHLHGDQPAGKVRLLV